MNIKTSRPVGLREVLVRAHGLGRAMHPALTMSAVKHQIRILSSAIKNRAILQQWFGTTNNPLRTRAIKRFPLIEGAIYWPYMNHTWPVSKRLAVIDQHYRMLDGVATILADATFSDVELVRCDESYPGLRLVLEKAPWFLREGEIVLSIFLEDERVYSVAFTLGLEAGIPVVYVGALQGRNLDNAMEIYRNITHAMHGMRPRDFLLAALKFLCAGLGLKTIWGVCSAHQQHNGSYFGSAHKEKLVADYDEVWTEHGGIANAHGFFEFPATVHYKEMSDIPSRKRANYKRRYAMLEKLESDIDTACKSR